ncbi:ATP-dependent DNA helicase PcrA, partial [Paenibacillus chibensis]|nr:ATP-dependent DNA helicase PcrA [Paenibacillus chibensis]
LSGSTATASGSQTKVTMTTSVPHQAAAVGSTADLTALKAGDKVSHGKWGTGTIVSVKGSGNDTELQIAFPAPVGVKRLLAGFAPITKVEG